MTHKFAILILLYSFYTSSILANAKKNLHLGFAGNIQVSPSGLAVFVEKYLNSNLNEINSVLRNLSLQDIPLYSRSSQKSIFPDSEINLSALRAHQIELSKTKVKCLRRNCIISLPVKKLSVNALLTVKYLNIPINFNVNFGLKSDHELFSWIHLSMSLNATKNNKSLLEIDPENSYVNLTDEDAFFFSIRNDNNDYHFDDSLLNSDLLRTFLEKSINEFAITAIAEALSTKLNSNKSLRYFIEKFISLNLPNIDLSGQIDFSSNERVQNKIRSMLIEIKDELEPKKIQDVHSYVKKYAQHLENNQIYSYYVICFLNEIIEFLEENRNEIPSIIRDEIIAIQSKVNQNLEKSKRNTFLKLELMHEEKEIDRPNHPYAMSLFLLGNDIEPPGFRDIVRHGKLYSADEHFVIGGLLNILKNIKLNSKKMIPSAKSEKAVKGLHSYHVEWRKIAKSLKQNSSSDFGEYVLSLLNAIRDHCIYFQKSSHATSMLSSIMMLSSFFEDLNLRSSHDTLDNFHARFILPIRFINRYMAYLHESKQFENIQLDLKDKDILIENARDLIIKFESAPIIKWDPVNSKFLISIKEVSASLLVSNKVRYTTRMSIDFHFVPDIKTDGEIYFRFHKLSSDMAFLPKKSDKFIDKILSMISLWTFLPHATKLTVVRHIAYTQIKNFLTNLHFPLPDLYIGSQLSLSPELNSIKYNQDHVFLELKLNQIYKID
ncbi:MAG: hypothetical protein AB8G05_10580 [Oligoflexales bacterium]